MSQAKNPFVSNPISSVSTRPFRFSHSNAINFVFENPKWMQNVLLSTVCMLIPIVGAIVVYGYHVEVIECLHRDRGRRYPNFDFDRFSEYLSRGVWVFLIYLIFGCILAPVMWFIIGGGIAMIGISATMAGADSAPWALIVTIPLFVVLVSGMLIFANMILIPMMLRAGLTQDLGQGFNFGFAMEFVGNTWLQIVISSLFMSVFSVAMMFLGLMVFCVGFYVAVAYLGLAMTHIGWQLYELHLSRGGSYIPLKPPTPSFPVPPVK